MRKQIVTVFLACVLIVSMLAGCGAGTGATSTAGAVQTTSGAAAGANTQAAAAAIPAATAAGSATEAAAANTDDHENAADYVWDSAAEVAVALGDGSIGVSGQGATVEGSTLTITAAGTYRLSGSLPDGQIVVNTQDEEVVRLILDGVDLKSSSGAPIHILAAGKVVIVLADGSENSVQDADSRAPASEGEDEPTGAIFSMADLTLYGSGSLSVEGTYRDGISSKDGLIIAGGRITVNAVDDGIRGKDYVVVQDGALDVTAGGDGMKSDNETDAGRGTITILGGTIVVSAGGDAIAAQTDVRIAGGDLDLTAAEGSTGRIAAELSAKGIKGVANVTIDGGVIRVDSADDAVHSNGSVVINGGTLTLSTGDDAIHGDGSVDVNGGEIHIVDSYEGVESAVITINAGTIDIVSSDDGVNIVGGNDGSGMMAGPGRRGRPGVAAGQDAFTVSSSNRLTVNGGTLIVDAAGDGFDVNGSVVMTGGLVLVSGPTENMNGALDYDGGFQISGGVLIAAGSAGMAQAPDTSSTQYSVLLNLSSMQRGGTLIHVRSSDGTALLTFAPARAYQSIVFSLPEIEDGSTYDVYLGGSATGTVLGGLYVDGTYTPGKEYGSMTVTGIVTGVGSRARW